MTNQANAHFAGAKTNLGEVQKYLSDCAALVSAAEIELVSGHPESAFIKASIAKDKLRGAESMLALGCALALHGLKEAAKP